MNPVNEGISLTGSKQGRKRPMIYNSVLETSVSKQSNNRHHHDGNQARTKYQSMPWAKASIPHKDSISRTSFSSISISTLFKYFSQHPSEEAGCICHYPQFQNSDSNKVIRSIYPNPHNESMLPTFPHYFQLLVIKFQMLRQSVPKRIHTPETGLLILPERQGPCWLDTPTHALYIFRGLPF